MDNSESVFIATEDDGSQWVSLADYKKLEQELIISELSLIEQIKRNSDLLLCGQIDNAED